ncbi:uncharacterized protein LOC110447907 [Mizuhopecten yessoensis]|uniref:C2H2-type domain-containing protein n=1 Tax=Mizuhopecten yessoensis TaxID=6573 RepID=A0A210QU90_MIZYE|nr:uncharacterized protein LOC110447907 [Mizuhopecten yessoensis]OWF52323.1 hypothetical protein KP79_PYT00607 [Mizuhopecten yessoensis]
MPARRAQRCGCGRGVFGLIDWTTPLRRPAALKNFQDAPVSPGVTSPQSCTSPFSPFPISPGNAVGSWADAMESPSAKKFKCGDKLLMKYSYTANEDSPLDQPELNVCQQDYIEFVCFHADNQLWSRVCNANGKEGYVPTDYLMIVEEQVNSLPWLPKSAEVQQEKVEYKPYKSAYQSNMAKESSKQQYTCDICCREFNGPLPYNAHMKSKAHMEEVMLLEDNS